MNRRVAQGRWPTWSCRASSPSPLTEKLENKGEIETPHRFRSKSEAPP